MTFLIGGFRLTNFGDFRLTVFGQFNPTLTDDLMPWSEAVQAECGN